MKPPITPYLLVPFLILCVCLFDFNNWGIPFAALSILSFLIEIKIRYGSLSRESIGKFFYTPIKKYDLMGNEIIDTSPKFSMASGVLIIVFGGFAVMALMVLYFAFVK